MWKRMEGGVLTSASEIKELPPATFRIYSRVTSIPTEGSIDLPSI